MIYFTYKFEMKNEVNNEDQHINHHKLIDYYQVILELFLMLIY
jgi:hypothetical protein